MKALNLKSIALFASILVLSAGFASCQDEPEMITPTVNTTLDDTLNNAYKESTCVVWWTVDEGVASVTVNGKVYPGEGYIKAEVGESITWEATVMPNYQFTSPGHNTFKVEAGAEGGVINIPITTQKGNL